MKVESGLCFYSVYMYLMADIEKCVGDCGPPGHKNKGRVRTLASSTIYF